MEGDGQYRVEKMAFFMRARIAGRMSRVRIEETHMREGYIPHRSGWFREEQC
jgi:hypothetical protein